MFDKKRCMDNIYAIAKDKKIKIGDLEKEAGVSGGYISKLNKEDNKAIPSIEILLSIAKVLGVSLDFLVSVNYAELGENEIYFSTFIDKLILGTEKQKVVWEIESGSYLNSNMEGDGFEHPLFISIPSVVEHPETGHLIDIVKNTYQSRFLAIDDVCKFGNCYHCELSKKQKLYMMKVYLGDANYSSEEELRICYYTKPEHMEIELYIVDERNNVSPLCSTFSVEGEMRELIKKMYDMVSTDRRTINVSSNVKGIIDDFMKLEW